VSRSWGGSEQGLAQFATRGAHHAAEGMCDTSSYERSGVCFRVVNFNHVFSFPFGLHVVPLTSQLSLMIVSLRKAMEEREKSKTNFLTKFVNKHF
jgi:hypothetical protein